MSNKSLTTGWCTVKKGYIQQDCFYSTSFWLIWDKQQPNRNQCFSEWLKVFVLSLHVRNQGPSSWPSGRKRADLEGTDWSCVLLGRLTIKRLAHGCGISLFFLLHETEVVCEDFKSAFSFPTESQGQTYYMGRKLPRQVAKARSAVSQGKWASTGYMALSTNSSVRAGLAHITSERSSHVWGLRWDKVHLSHGLFQFETN